MPPREFSDGGGGGSAASAPSTPKPDKAKSDLENDLSDEDTQLKDRGELCGQEQMSKDSDLDVQEHAPTPSPPKSGKGKSELENHPSEEDIQLKDLVELWVEMLKNPDPDVQEHALDTLREEVCSSSYAMGTVPKPLEFLLPHYEALKDCCDRMHTSAPKRKMENLLAAL